MLNRLKNVRCQVEGKKFFYSACPISNKKCPLYSRGYFCRKSKNCHSNKSGRGDALCKFNS